MAGDWTKMRNDLRDDPAVVTIATKLSLDVDTVIGKLHAVWAWAGAHTVTGKCAAVTLCHVDYVARCKLFGDAMMVAEWLEADSAGRVTFPKWAKHNGKASKQRALAAERASRKRARDITDASRNTVTSNAPREEKRRGIKTPLKPPQGGASAFQTGGGKRNRTLSRDQAGAATASAAQETQL